MGNTGHIMKNILLAIFAACLLSGCATNISYAEKPGNNFEWIENNADWKIASDYYHLKNRLPGITYAVYGYPKCIKPGTVDERVVQHFAEALALKGYSAAQISDFGDKGVSVVGMPELMYDNWIATSSQRDIANDLYLLCGNRSGSYRVLPGEKTSDKKYTIAMYEIALVEKGWNARRIKKLKEGKLCYGMSKVAVEVVLGRPDEINKSTYGILQTEQWVWTSGQYQLPKRYVHFHNGVVSSFTELDARH